MDVFVEQLASLCREHVTRNKWVFVPSQRVAKADFWAEAQGALRRGAVRGGRGRVLASGVMDLLFESVRGWEVRDYKTDRTLDDRAYAAQMRIYANALRAVGCTPAAQGTCCTEERGTPPVGGGDRYSERSMDRNVRRRARLCHQHGLRPRPLLGVLSNPRLSSWTT
jgi:hypothetical protein